jgi:hypothetical protein
MTLLDDNTRRLLQMTFDDVPIEHKARAYGVDYAHLLLNSGGELFLTRYGWALRKLTVPNAWFVDRRYKEAGRKLLGTGTVYCVPTAISVGATEDVVVKFSRVAQDVPIFVDKPVADMVPRAFIDSACFNDPFEEFGLLAELRRGPFGPNRPRILTKRPLAIYSPPGDYKPWQLGRKDWLFAQHIGRLKADQDENAVGVPVSLHPTRDYVLLFQWVKGFDAEQLYAQGVLKAEDLRSMYDRSTLELQANGFVVLDHKPRHLILRSRQSGNDLLAWNGAVKYALIDFELLKRVPSSACGAMAQELAVSAS